MNSPSAHFVPARRIAVYDPIQQISMWGENFKSNSNLNTSASLIVEDVKLDNQSEDASHGTVGPSDQYDQEATNKPADKVQRRLAQNREAARKSRLRKKAYVQQLETSRLKLIQIEQELDRARQQGLYMGGGLDASQLGFSATVNSGVATFEMEYGHWVEEQNRQTCDLRNALNAHIGDTELQMLVTDGLSHYFQLFRIKATATKADVFYVMSGMWKTSAERFFLWIGGFRPSELLKVLVPQIDPMTEHQVFEVTNLRQSCEQAEDALTQGMDKLQETLAKTVASSQLVEENYIPQMGTAVEKLEALVNFVSEIIICKFPTESTFFCPKEQQFGLYASGFKGNCLGKESF
ncbi:transcription factor TGA1-like isoform X2 [Corylus avellana]|uniref:transcription factor TGA1-like isoform X2 n=1 Tax=Corylus avellana TaxID=13451 RepID=UPI00286B441E|nr:transcription factor TGA1-like isoform X2 [Corylus avellana]